MKTGGHSTAHKLKGARTMWWVVEIADEIDGFISVFADTAEEAEREAEEQGYDVLYAHAEDEE